MSSPLKEQHAKMLMGFSGRIPSRGSVAELRDWFAAVAAELDTLADDHPIEEVFAHRNELTIMLGQGLIE